MQHAVLRQLPSDLLTFLDDAARRGVLRRHGPVFEFRHRRVQRFLADSKEAGRPTGDLIAEARALADGNDFKGAVKRLTQLVPHDGRAVPALAEIHEAWAGRRRWNPFNRDDRKKRLQAAQRWWETSLDAGDPQAALELARFHERRLDSFPGSLLGGLRSYRTHNAAVKAWKQLAETTPPPDRDQIVTLMERRSKAPLPTRFHKHYVNHITAVLDGLHEAGPPPVDELGWWTSTPLGDVTATALQHAASHHPGVLQTGTVFAALMDADPRAGDWARFALHTSSPSADELRRAVDAHPEAAGQQLPLDDAAWTITVSEDLMSGLRLLPRMAAEFGMTPIPPGALALALLSAPTGGAARMLRAYGGVDDVGLRRLVKEDLIGIPELPDLDQTH
ncbi:hypothetical protein [Amycolatopsis lexingtonensis]|uniref:hypothetical protein n=1 Tax=Amycolatopsis lexingtonensis TaxID=218822 RepID=UPI003F6F7414